MRIVAVALLAMLGCEQGTSGDTPAAAARCMVRAIEAKSIDRWAACTHPDARAAMRAELAEEVRDPEFWTDAAKKLAPLAGVKDEQFTIAPTTGDETRWGDTRASYRYSDRGKLDLVKKDGRWYVVDPD
jgi:hypothetical protein